MDTKIEKYLNSNIKDIINEFNEVQIALDKYDIGCAPCALGTCKLKDVVGIHDLSEQDEKKLISQIFKIIYPDETFDIPRIAPETKNISNSPNLSPPLRILVDEHVTIIRMIALIPKICNVLDLQLTEHKQTVLEVTDFIKNYADKFHHAKEEDILFRYFEDGLDIITVMIKDHENSRGFVKQIIEALETKNSDIVKQNLLKYAELLTEHIKKEDSILYPWMDRNLDTNTVGRMYSKFFEINNQKTGIQQKYQKIIEILEEKF